LGQAYTPLLLRISRLRSLSVLKLPYFVSRAYSYATIGVGVGAGAMLLTKVVLGTIRKVNAFREVIACPPGFHSVRFFF